MIEIFDFIRNHFGIISTIFAVVAGAFWLKMDSKYAKKSDLAALTQQCNSKVDSNDHRITLLESKVDNLPTAQDIANLQVLMTEIKGETKATNSQLMGVVHQVGLLLEAKVLNQKD